MAKRKIGPTPDQVAFAEVWNYAAKLAIKDGKAPLNALSGFWQRKVGESWEIWLHAQKEPLKLPSGTPLEPFTMYVEFNGWPAGVLDPHGGSIAAGSLANIYVEPFAGSLAVLLARPHEPRIETVNDRDCHISNFWRALKADPRKVAHYADWPVNECDMRARHQWLCNRKVFRERMLKEPGLWAAARSHLAATSPDTGRRRRFAKSLLRIARRISNSRVLSKSWRNVCRSGATATVPVSRQRATNPPLCGSGSSSTRSVRCSSSGIWWGESASIVVSFETVDRRRWIAFCKFISYIRGG